MRFIKIDSFIYLNIYVYNIIMAAKTETATNKRITYTVDEMLKVRDSVSGLPKGMIDYITSLKEEAKKAPRSWKKDNFRLRTTWIANKYRNQETNNTEKVADKVRGILNKLSDTHFEKLTDELLELVVETEDELDIFVDLVFKKATGEYNFSPLYAEMCHKLSGCYIEEKSKKIFFRELLLNKCQKYFMDILKETKNKEVNETIRNKSVGCMIFIGNLYIKDLLTNNIIYNCLTNLISFIEKKNFWLIKPFCEMEKVVLKDFYSKYKLGAKAIFEKTKKLIEEDEDEVCILDMDNKEQFMIMDVTEMIEMLED